MFLINLVAKGKMLGFPFLSMAMNGEELNRSAETSHPLKFVTLCSLTGGDFTYLVTGEIFVDFLLLPPKKCSGAAKAELKLSSR